MSAGAVSGHFFESFVFSEILKSYTNAGIEADFYYLRDGSHREIDLIIHENNTLYPIEIKTKAEPGQDDTKSFSLLDSIAGIRIGEGGIICLAKEILPLKARTFIILLWAV